MRACKPTSASFFHLNGLSIGEDKWDVDRQWLKSIGSQVCIECTLLLPNVEAFDVHVTDDIGVIPLTGTGAIDVGIIHKKFVDQLGEQLFRELFHLGRVFGPERTELPDYLSFRGKNGSFRIRGGPTSTNYICKSCGQHVYFPLMTAYILADRLPTRPICESPLSQLIVSRGIYSQLDFNRWPRESRPYIQKLPIRTEPLDGHDLDATPPAIDTRWSRTVN